MTGTCSLDVKAEALREFPKTDLLGEIAPLVSRLHRLLSHEGPEEGVEADLPCAVGGQAQGYVVKPGVIHGAGFTIGVG